MRRCGQGRRERWLVFGCDAFGRLRREKSPAVPAGDQVHSMRSFRLVRPCDVALCQEIAWKLLCKDKSAIVVADERNRRAMKKRMPACAGMRCDDSVPSRRRDVRQIDRLPLARRGSVSTCLIAGGVRSEAGYRRSGASERVPQAHADVRTSRPSGTHSCWCRMPVRRWRFAWTGCRYSRARTCWWWRHRTSGANCRAPPGREHAAGRADRR